MKDMRNRQAVPSPPAAVAPGQGVGNPAGRRPRIQGFVLRVLATSVWPARRDGRVHAAFYLLPPAKHRPFWAVCRWRTLLGEAQAGWAWGTPAG